MSNKKEQKRPQENEGVVNPVEFILKRFLKEV